MKSRWKTTATFYMAVYLGLLACPIATSKHVGVSSNLSADENPIITAAQNDGLLFTVKVKDLSDRKPDKPLRQLRISLSTFLNPPTDRKVFSYFFINDIQNNQPLIQFRIPLSAHSEEG